MSAAAKDRVQALRTKNEARLQALTEQAGGMLDGTTTQRAAVALAACAAASGRSGSRACLAQS